METEAPIPAKEREFLRELAKKQCELAMLPIMAERKRLWFLHNRLEGERPMVVMEEIGFVEEIIPPPCCEHPFAARMENQFTQVITAFSLFDDDKVVPDFFPVYFDISTDFLGQKVKKTKASDGIGFHLDPIFATLEEGLPMLQPSYYVYRKNETEAYEKAAMDVFGDILPIIRKNSFNNWFITPTKHVVYLMGMENMYCAMIAEPDDFHRLMRLVTDDLLRCLRWQEENGLLLLNNDNDYIASGSYGFSDELPVMGSKRTSSGDTWGHLDSQESIGLSPGQFNEFIYPYYEELACEFGLVYYGCCEPVHAYWDSSLYNLSNLRKISISHWCNEDFMAERLTGSKVIFSRKPSPNLIGIKSEFDEEAFTAYIKKTVAAVKGRCKAEIIFRDIYSLHGNSQKTRRAVDITRNLTETMY